MVTLSYGDARVELGADETVLDALLRAGIEVGHGCRSGACRSCMLVARPGTVPERAQAGLREVERRQGVFLACLCRPDQDLDLRELDSSSTIPAKVVEVARLSESVVRLRLEPEQPFDYEPGQYLSVVRGDGLIRSYSIASTKREPWLELHLRRLPDGRMSRWAYDEAKPGDALAVRGPFGSCCCVGEPLDTPLLLVGVGTGLAPAWGIVREALDRGHQGPITLIQAAVEPRGLYLRDALAALSASHPQLQVHSCVLRAEPDDRAGVEIGAVDAVAVAKARERGPAAKLLAFVCGDPAIVARIRRGLFLAGVPARRILADPFVYAPASG